MEYQLYELVLISSVLVVGAAVQGSVGYGLAMIASPILLMIDPRFIPGPVTIVAFIIVILILLRDGKSIDFAGLKWALIGLFFGMPLAIIILVRFSIDQFVILFGLLTVLAVIISAVGVRFRPNKSVLTTAGFFAGMMGILTTLAGVPMALVYQDSPGNEIRGTLSGFFIIGTVYAIILLSLVGRFGVQEIGLSLLLLPGALIGFFLSTRIYPWLDRGYIRPAILGVAGLSACILLLNQILSI